MNSTQETTSYNKINDMKDNMKAVRKYVFDKICVECGKQAYTRCEYVNGSKDVPWCIDGEALHRAFLAGIESAKEREDILVEACKGALKDTEMLLNEECEFTNENLQATIDALRGALNKLGRHEDI